MKYRLNLRSEPSFNNSSLTTRMLRTPTLAKPIESELAKNIPRAVTLVKPIYSPINVTFGSYNGKIYFFHTDGTYSRFDRKTSQLEYYAPTTYWKGWPSHWNRPDAAVSWETQHVYFFRGSEYIRYDLNMDQVEYIAPIREYWDKQRWPAYWNNVDAALYWDCLFDDYNSASNPCPPNVISWKRKVYFFRDDEYLRYDVTGDRIDDGYPKKIIDYWTGWPQHWTRIQGAFDWGNGKLYFFSGEEYLRYDKFFDKVDSGYPRPVLDFFKEHEDKLNNESQSLIFENQVPISDRKGFISAVRNIAGQLNIRPNWLMGSIWSESGFNPHIGENGGNYVGLHQMSIPLIYSVWGRTSGLLRNNYPQLFWGQDFKDLDPTAKKVLSKEFGNLGFNQIVPIGNWLRGALASQKVTCCSFDQLRLIGFGGQGFGGVDRTLLASVVAPSNPCYDLDKNRQIDLGEFRTSVFYLMQYKFRNNPQLGDIVRHQLG